MSRQSVYCGEDISTWFDEPIDRQTANSPHSECDCDIDIIPPTPEKWIPPTKNIFTPVIILCDTDFTTHQAHFEIKSLISCARDLKILKSKIITINHERKHFVKLCLHMSAIVSHGRSLYIYVNLRPVRRFLVYMK